MKAYTAVLFPIGTYFELFTDTKPAVGEVFNIQDIHTRKIVQKARVTEIQNNPYSPPKYRVISVITADRHTIER